MQEHSPRGRSCRDNNRWGVSQQALPGSNQERAGNRAGIARWKLAGLRARASDGLGKSLRSCWIGPYAAAEAAIMVALATASTWLKGRTTAPLCL